VQADAEHVGAKPAPARDDVAEDCEAHQPALTDEAAPARVEDEGVPQDDDQRAIFLGVPAPEPAPGLVGPDAAEDGADEAEEGREADDPIDHPAEGVRRAPVERGRADAAEDVDQREHAREEGHGVPGRHHHHMGRQPEV
jgi:hypothetical protein